MSIRFWLCAGMTLLSSCVSAFYSIAGVMGDGRHNHFAQYAASRSMSLLLLVFVSVLFRRREPVLTLAWCMSVIQFADSWIGFLQKDPVKIFGPLAFAVVNGILAYLVWKERRSESQDNHG